MKKGIQGAHREGWVFHPPGQSGRSSPADADQAAKWPTSGPQCTDIATSQTAHWCVPLQLACPDTSRRPARSPGRKTALPRRLFLSSGPPGRRSDTPAQEAGERDPPIADSTAAQQPGSRPRPIRPPHGPANGTRPAGPLPPATEGRVPPSGRHLPRTNSGDGRDNRTEGCAGSESHRSR